jgi:hypothetical protein
MTENEKYFLKPVLEQNGFVDLDESLFHDLNNVLIEKTLGNKVATALKDKKQGQFDKAMLKISEANRDQILSVREIQTILDKSEGHAKTEVIFEKYRQFYPFQIGLTNGEEVLELLNLIRVNCDFDIDELVADMHKKEEMIDPILEEVNFYETRMDGQNAEGDINELKNKIRNLSDNLNEIKTKLVDCFYGFIQNKYFHLSQADKIKLIKNCYIILTSSIQTLDSGSVIIEKGT